MNQNLKDSSKMKIFKHLKLKNNIQHLKKTKKFVYQNLFKFLKPLEKFFEKHIYENLLTIVSALCLLKFLNAE